MQVVLLAGGLGSRLAEETVRVPKPMVEVGGRPVILHVMDIYSRWNHTDFVVACGFKAMQMKAFFQGLHLLNNDFTVALGNGEMQLAPCRPVDWRVSVVDTGLSTMTGGRLRRLPGRPDQRRGRCRRPQVRRAPAQPGGDAVRSWPSIRAMIRSSGLATAWIVRVETLV